MSDLFWLELREPGCTPQRKGGFKQIDMAKTLREFFAARPTAFITVVTVAHYGPDFQDGPEALMMIDMRSKSTALRHIRSACAAHAAYRGRFVNLSADQSSAS